jgi:hypothetical protein
VDWGKPRQTSGKIAGLGEKILTLDFPNTRQENANLLTATFGDYINGNVAISYEMFHHKLKANY